MERIDTNILFDGHKVYVIPQEVDIVILCKGVKGFLSQVKSFLKQDNPGRIYYFGNRKIELDMKSNVRIDCLADTKTKIQEIESFCQSINTQQYK